MTPRKKQILEFINSYSRKRGFAPSIPEIAKRFNLAISTIHQHLAELEVAGYLKKERGQPRSIAVVGREVMVQIPLLGTIAAGQPITLFDVPKETIAIPKSKIPPSSEVYALRVAGNSMIDENINDGDIILVRQQETAENGQKVVALIDDHEATLKKFYRERGYIRLQPANKSMEPIILRKDRDISIQGIVLDVIRDMSTAITESGPRIRLDTESGSSKHVPAPKPYYERPRFKLYRSDCLELLAALPENSVDMVFADPPYNLSNGGFTVHAGRMVSVNKGDWDKSRGFKDDYDFHYKWLEAAKRVLKPGGTLWVSGTYHSIYQCGHALQALGYHILNDIAWFKPNAAPNLSCRFFTASHETLLWARKDKKSKHTFNYGSMKNGEWGGDFLKKPDTQMRSVWAIGTPKQHEKRFGKHPTQKPYDLLKRIVLASTNKNDLVIDPFTGSSTTGIAAYLQGRSFIGIDTESKFLDLSIRRFEGLDGSRLA